MCGIKNNQRGFTLIELSIVLVIIGLLVGSVLVGQNLIAASQLRAQVTQFEKYNAAVDAFHGKYDCLPGDCVNATTFLPTIIGTSYTNGNGNGVLDSWYSNNHNDTTGFPGSVENEPTLFWVHLDTAGLTDCCDMTRLGQNYFSTYIIGRTFPQDRVNGGGIGTGAIGGRNGYYWGITSNCTGSCNSGNNAPNYAALGTSAAGVLTPAQAYAFDAKIDDGFPTSGNVYTAWIGTGDGHVHPQGYTASWSCVANTTPNTYNTSYASTICNLWINMQGM